jgi:hypothetical protein
MKVCGFERPSTRNDPGIRLKCSGGPRTIALSPSSRRTPFSYTLPLANHRVYSTSQRTVLYLVSVLEAHFDGFAGQLAPPEDRAPSPRLQCEPAFVMYKTGVHLQ